ncbi:kinase-like domain-containing protein [Aspergillus venezuelensis]
MSTHHSSEPNGNQTPSTLSPANNVADTHSQTPPPEPATDLRVCKVYDEKYGWDQGYGLAHRIPGAEEPWSYLHGMHHPTLLGDHIGPQEQYRVIHKLGTGGFANVWLCRRLDTETSEYVAVKIIQARLSGKDSRELENIRWLKELAKTDAAIAEYCVLPIDEFCIDGPNGVHQCFVYPAAGPCVKELMATIPDPQGYLRSLTRQAAEAMAALHRNGMCHGDFRPSNLLLRLDGLNGLEETEVLDILDWPYCEDILIADDANPHASLPEYIVRPLEFDYISMQRFKCNKLCVIDFGESFQTFNPPKGTGIPLHFAPPELALADECGTASDIFALAATMYHIRFGEKMFEMQEQSINEYIYMMIKQLGRFPEPLWSEWVERWRDVQDVIMEDTTNDERLDEEVVRRRHINGRVKIRVGHFLRRSKKEGGFHDPLPDEERELFEDLLYAMTENDPTKRPSIEQVLAHPWFSYKHETNVASSPFDAEIQQQESPITTSQPASPEPADIPLPDDASFSSSSPSVEMLDVEESEQVDTRGSASPSPAPAHAHSRIPPRSESPIAQTIQTNGSLGADWTQEIDAMRTSVLAVSAWFSRTFGL